MKMEEKLELSCTTPMWLFVGHEAFLETKFQVVIYRKGNEALFLHSAVKNIQEKENKDQEKGKERKWMRNKAMLMDQSYYSTLRNWKVYNMLLSNLQSIPF